MCLLEYFRRAEEQGKPHVYLRVCIRAFVYIYIYTNNYLYVMLYIYIYILLLILVRLYQLQCHI